MYIGKDYQAKQIKKHQKFLLKLLHLHIGNYYPLRQWLGIDYKGKINEITNLSIAYNAKKVKKGYQITRTYQSSDLGYKLNLILDKIPQLALLPALLQPAYGLGALAFFFLTEKTYQPSTKDTYMYVITPNTNYNDEYSLSLRDVLGQTQRALLEFDISDIPADATFSQGDFSLTYYSYSGTNPSGKTVLIYKMTHPDWVEAQATWNIYKTGSAWTVAGGDYVTTNPSGGGANIPAEYGLVTWDIQAIIENAYSVPQNVELLMKYQTEGLSSGGSSSVFYSNSYWVPSGRPKLTVTYTVPTVTGAAFLLQMI